MNQYLFKGNLISLIASAFILAELILLLVYGLSYIFTNVSKVLLWIILIMAFPSYITYYKAELKKGMILKLAGIIAIIIALIGMLFVQINDFLGVGLILIGYLFEPIAGISIFITLNTFNKLYSALFFYGALVFTLGLPLYLINLGIIAIIGDIVKMVGLYYLVKNGNRLLR
ncbi:hypothetical protein BFU36_11300 [Sulfolobus sp. A20]|uniref:hypothetical protein n=1 Tax=Saccharolobus sp. A20 TaxID=1891280 RepID=UPI000845DE57|nr:hypothetical protein [Sulfolobus sp. A20]TRM76941.1 hypothetical protein DJ523_00130 [Sulfolobus sp. E5]TRM77432.1 hypothetical protein DJ532_04555 [Sulfolobus sp. A20-N-F8]TRM78664.1 hypothetical protein DJ528_04385 [Sulfolobus sp. B5]TRM82444.1 hypothetical protein DJ524_00470 [Sulfolobus sp. D5]TRM84079.1 hypothetical protein DJ531_02135 [Sulfolobus sp. A20-N-F6]TRM87998.1 hypothetical protein DJ521_02680 [Sulfolobus sp. E3]TRM88246.1 hypothetical protein DJ529_05960 [Sulfolobus sp. C3